MGVLFVIVESVGDTSSISLPAFYIVRQYEDFASHRFTAERISASSFNRSGRCFVNSLVDRHIDPFGS
jgi:hypothetical protein